MVPVHTCTTCMFACVCMSGVCVYVGVWVCVCVDCVCVCVCVFINAVEANLDKGLGCIIGNITP